MMNLIKRYPTSVALVLSVTCIVAGWSGAMLLQVSPSASYGDEGVVVQAASRILAGQVPFRDFFSAGTPGTAYWYALFMKVIDPPFLGVRIGVLTVATINLGLVLLILRQLRALTTLSVLFVVPTLGYVFGPAWFIASHHWLSLLFCLLCLYLLLRADSSSAPGWWFFASGCAATLAAFMLQTLGGVWMIAATCGVLAWSRKRQKSELLWFVSGLMLSGLPLVGLFVYLVGLDLLIYDLIEFPLTRYRLIPGHEFSLWNSFSLTWETFLSTIPYATGIVGKLRVVTAFGTGLFILVLVAMPFLGLGALIYLYREKGMGRSSYWLIVLFFLATHASYLYRITGITLLYPFVSSLLAVSLCVVSLRSKRSAPTISAKGINLFATLWIFYFCLFTGASFLYKELAGKVVIKTPAGDMVSYKVKEYKTLAGVVGFFEDKKGPSDAVFCYAYNPFFYMLLQKDNVTRLDIISTPMHTQEQIDQIQRRLEDVRPKWVLWDYNSLEKNSLGRYIDQNYLAREKFKYIAILERRLPDDVPQR